MACFSAPPSANAVGAARAGEMGRTVTTGRTFGN